MHRSSLLEPVVRKRPLQGHMVPRTSTSQAITNIPDPAAAPEADCYIPKTSGYPA